MKTLLILAAALVPGMLGCFWFRSAPKVAPMPEIAMASLSSKPAAPQEKFALRTSKEAAEIFQRAFWREPTSEDRILHAERREWVGEKDGVRRWQWFLVVEPGSSFSTWLRERNPFNLAKIECASMAAVDSPPAWFRAAADLVHCEIQQARDGAMTLIFDPGQNRLYACDAGNGIAVAKSR